MIDAKQLNRISAQAHSLKSQAMMKRIFQNMYNAALEGEFCIVLKRDDDKEFFDFIPIIEKFFSVMGYKVSHTSNLIMIRWR